MSQPNRFVQTAATLLILSSVVGIVVGTLAQYLPFLTDPKGTAFLWDGALLVVLHVLDLIGIVGFAVSGAVGKGWLGRIGLAIALLGYTLILIAEGVLRFAFDSGNMLFGLAVPLAGLGFILAGIAVLRAKQWTGWHSFVPLATGLYPFVILLPVFALSGGVNFLAIAGWALCRLVLGVALAQTNQAPNPNPAPLQNAIAK